MFRHGFESPLITPPRFRALGLGQLRLFKKKEASKEFYHGDEAVQDLEVVLDITRTVESAPR